MNYSTAIFLINDHVRAVATVYEAGEGAKRTIFKTFDKSIKAGDFVIVPTETRHKMTVVKVVDVDIDIDFNSAVPVAWIIGTVDRTEHEKMLAQEQTAIAAIRSEELRKQRDDLREKLFADRMETLKALPIAVVGDGESAKA